MLSQEFIDRFHSKTQTTLGGCILWVGAKGPHGYGNLRIQRKFGRAHRIAWEIANGPIPENLSVCHHCDVRLCVNPAHLFLGTAADNSTDRDAKGRGNYVEGERHYKTKLTLEDARYIKRSSLPQAVLAEKFGIAKNTVGNIQQGKNWKSA